MPHTLANKLARVVTGDFRRRLFLTAALAPLLAGCSSRLLGVGVDLSPQVAGWTSSQEPGSRDAYRTRTDGVQLEIRLVPHQEYPFRLTVANETTQDLDAKLILDASAEALGSLGKLVFTSNRTGEFLALSEFRPPFSVHLAAGTSATIYLLELPGLSLRSPRVGDVLTFRVELLRQTGRAEIPLHFQVLSVHEVRSDHLLIGH